MKPKSIRELAATETPDVRGASNTFYGLQPVQFLKEIVDAAKKQLYFANFVRVMYAPKGVHDVVIPKRTAFEGRSGMTFNTAGSDTGGSGAGTGPYANTIADISWTSLDNLTSVTVTPQPVLAGYALRRYDIDTNAVNLLEAAREELSYAIGDRVDRAVAVAIGDATVAADTTVGAQTLYGGDATGADELSAGDVITTDLVAKGKRYLQQTKMYYRADGANGTETLATSTKNPWNNTSDDPFVLFIAPAQEETFLKDSQFVNAAEYGSDMIVKNGEIGTYLGIRVVVTNNVEQTAASGTAPDATSAAVACTRCILCKPKAACALVWGKSPEIKVFDYPTQDQMRIGLYTAYNVGVLQADAIVFIDVSDA